MNILLGLTGSVAVKLAHKLVRELSKIGNVRVALTASAEKFFRDPDQAVIDLTEAGAKLVLNDNAEWTAYQKKGDIVWHVECRKWADVFVVAPLTKHTLAKMCLGLCDNLLTSIVAAWDWDKPMILVPAMNTLMWENQITQQHIVQVKEARAIIVPPVEKMLACGDVGKGAMADIADIVEKVNEYGRWMFPIKWSCRGIPVGDHPGAFGARRKYDRHCGVDLYCPAQTEVYAVESGTVVKVQPFTGTLAGCDWWQPTWAVKVQGPSGVVCYGEIDPCGYWKEGAKIERGQFVGRVVPVLRPGKLRHDIPGHSRSMLHMQLYEHNRLGKDNDWTLDGPQPEGVLDPTQKLIQAHNAPQLQVTMQTQLGQIEE